VAARRRIFETYVERLGSLPGISFMPEGAYGTSNRWLTCMVVAPEAFGATREDIRKALEACNVESRPVWKPMHLQPVFAGCRHFGGAVAEHFFRDGLCLPSGSSLSPGDQDRVIEIVRRQCRAA